MFGFLVLSRRPWGVCGCLLGLLLGGFVACHEEIVCGDNNDLCPSGLCQGRLCKPSKPCQALSDCDVIQTCRQGWCVHPSRCFCKATEICQGGICRPSDADASSEPNPDLVTEAAPERPPPTPGMREVFPIKNGVAFATRYIPSGSFTMGSPPSEPGRAKNEEQFKATLTWRFWMMETEVTQSQFRAVMNYLPSSASACGGDCPVESVTWHEVAAFANVLSRASGREECFDCIGSGSSVSCAIKMLRQGKGYFVCNGWRLPTEAEWEYAYRAGTTTAFYNGPIENPLGCEDKNAKDIACFCRESSSGACPVGQKKPNAWGLLDMAGNVAEWVYDLNGSYPTSDEENPLRSKGEGDRIFRGGGWTDLPSKLRAAYRHMGTPTKGYSAVGFRLVRGAD